MTATSIDTARDAAQQMVTACMHRDRTTAAQIATEYPDPLVLALVLADLVAYVNHCWGQSLGFPEKSIQAAWAGLLADVEEWRTSG